MFVTTQPGRPVTARTVEIEKKAVSEIGSDGLFSRIRAHGTGLVVSAPQDTSHTDGYALADGEILEFSGTMKIYNSTDAAAKVSLMIFDTI